MVSRGKKVIGYDLGILEFQEKLEKEDKLTKAEFARTPEQTLIKF